MKPLIEIDNLCVKTTDNKVLVEPLNLVLKPAQNLTILGETGSGKSLLAQAIMGALPTSLIAQGDIRFAGKSLSIKQRKKLWGNTLAMLPQEPCRSLDPTMNIFKQTWESHYYVAQQSSSQAAQQSQQKLQTLSLNHALYRFPHQLSGGMAQRAAFAIATGAGASIIIADEPTKGLDHHNKQIIIDMLNQVTLMGGTVLTITHDIEVARQLQGNIMVMKKGQLLEYGEASQVLQHPRSDYARQLIAAAPQNWTQRLNSSESAPDKPLLEVQQLSLARQHKRLFHNLSFQLRQGEILGISGTSGTGKSSLGDALCGLLSPSEGSIQWHQPLTQHAILKLYQDPPAAFAPHLPLQTLLFDVIQRHQLDASRIPALLQQLHLSPELLSRSAEQVSGGELQRIAILRVLLFQPKVIFADEVTSRLDPITQQKTIQLLVEQCQQNHCALILVSHDTDLLMHSCHQVIDLARYVQ